MIVLAIILAAILAGSLGVNAWLVHGRIADKDKSADARVAQVVTEAEGDRTAYELEVTRKALTAANLRAATLEEELKHAFERSDLGAGLAPADAGGRVLRLVKKWGQAAAARNPIPAESDGEALPVEPAADEAGPVVSVNDDRL